MLQKFWTKVHKCWKWRWVIFALSHMAFYLYHFKSWWLKLFKYRIRFCTTSSWSHVLSTALESTSNAFKYRHKVFSWPTKSTYLTCSNKLNILKCVNNPNLCYLKYISITRLPEYLSAKVLPLDRVFLIKLKIDAIIGHSFSPTFS